MTFPVPTNASDFHYELRDFDTYAMMASSYSYWHKRHKAGHDGCDDESDGNNDGSG